MAKDKEKQLASYYYVEKQKTAKETAVLVGITEATMNKWVNESGWKSQREARATSHVEQSDNIRNLISEMASQRIALSKELNKAMDGGDEGDVQNIRKQLAIIDDGVSKWNKTLENINKRNKISLNIYLEIMDRIFNAMRDYDQNLFLKTIDFQEQHIGDASIKY